MPAEMELKMEMSSVTALTFEHLGMELTSVQFMIQFMALEA